MPDATQMSEFTQLISELGPVLGVLAVVLGTVIAGYFQFRVAQKQVDLGHQSQLQIVSETHRQNLELLRLNQDREEDLRVRQYRESDRADRLVVLEYIDLILPRLTDICAIRYLGANNRDEDELKRYVLLQRYMLATDIDLAHPEKNLALRLTFLLYQLIGAMRIALNARWTRPLSAEQSAFLAHWEDHIEPVVCSGRYPGKELLYREQVEIVAAEMVVKSETTSLPRPLNWKEFCTKYESDTTWRELCNIVGDKLRFIFVDTNAPPPRRAMQCRLGILALYLIKMSQEAGNEGWNWRQDALWATVADWYKWEFEQGQHPGWWVFKYGDVRLQANA